MSRNRDDVAWNRTELAWDMFLRVAPTSVAMAGGLVDQLTVGKLAEWCFESVDTFLRLRDEELQACYGCARPNLELTSHKVPGELGPGDTFDVLLCADCARLGPQFYRDRL